MKIKSLILCIALLVGGLIAFGQTFPRFEISEIINKDSVQTISKNFKFTDNDTLFEDIFYTVTKSCKGEWGGAIKFISKKNDTIYTAEATCPMAVNKIGDKYFVTNTLAHLSGSTNIYEIADPTTMEVWAMPEKDGLVIRYVGYDQSKSIKGTKNLVRRRGYLTLYSFVYEKQLFHITTDYGKTYLTIIKNGDFETIDTISNADLRTSPILSARTDNGIILKVSKGYIDISQNQITVIRKE